MDCDLGTYLLKNMEDQAFECTSAKRWTCLEIKFEVKVILLDIIHSPINASNLPKKKKDMHY